MSGSVTVYNGPVLFRRPRGIDSYIPDCAIEEAHRDTLDITNHPVEQGATVNDHAFKQPAEVTLHWSWSNSSPQSTGESWDQQMYAALLQLQISRNLFSMITGKRSYNNMLIAEIAVITDSNSEYSLATVMTCKQLIIVQTQAASGPVGTTSTQSLQTDAPTTAPIVNQGQQQAQPQTSPPAGVLAAVSTT